MALRGRPRRAWVVACTMWLLSFSVGTAAAAEPFPAWAPATPSSLIAPGERPGLLLVGRGPGAGLPGVVTRLEPQRDRVQAFEITVRAPRGPARVTAWYRVEAAGRPAYVHGRAAAVGPEPSRMVFDVLAPRDAVAVLVGVNLASGEALEVGPLASPDLPDTSAARALGPALARALEVIETNGLHAAATSWALVRDHLHRRPAASLDEDLRFVFAAMADPHSHRLTATDPGTSPPPAPEPLLTSAADTGYLRVPTFRSTDKAAGERFSSAVRQGLRQHAADARCGWVVDVRGNQGGNLWPMLAGLAPFLGRERLGEFETRDGERMAWSAAPPATDSAAIDVEPDLVAVPVVVLVDARTASSGEAVALAFKGRGSTSLLGARTAGLTTANRSFQLPDGSTLNLAVARMLDRHGHRHDHGVEPDLAAAGLGARASSPDPALDTARRHLVTRCPRSRPTG